MPDVNADFTRRILLHAADMPWIPSPVEGVDRRMLDRLGDETARATSIVRYAPNSRFSPHTHHGGEEFLVLEGIFEDEHGSYPAGTYIRNPPTSKHTPGSTPGCTLFVKLWQFDAEDRRQVRININSPHNAALTQQSGSTFILHEDRFESVRIESFGAGGEIRLDCLGGAEILVLQGNLTEAEDRLRRYSWCRLPEGYHYAGCAGETGCVLWIKTGHLAHARRPETNTN
jgi:anti-sigma factor ChrR (cupin superfamily)